jgi:hypothetical protein
MTVKLSSLRTGCALLPQNIIFLLLLVLISVRSWSFSKFILKICIGINLMYVNLIVRVCILLRLLSNHKTNPSFAPISKMCFFFIFWFCILLRTIQQDPKKVPPFATNYGCKIIKRTPIVCCERWYLLWVLLQCALFRALYDHSMFRPS